MFDTALITPAHALRYGALPTQWAEGFPLGNGELGVMCWSDGERLKFTLDSAGAWDLRRETVEQRDDFPTYADLVNAYEEDDGAGLETRIGTGNSGVGPTKLYLGRLEIEVQIDSCDEFRLSLAEAEVTASLSARGRACRMSAFVCRDRDVFCLQLDPWPEGTQLSFLPYYETTPELAALGNPEMRLSERDGLTVAVQHVLPDTFLALCWNPTGPDVFVAYACATDEATAADNAVARHASTTREGRDALLRSHRDQWQQFWNVSGISLPERELEILWFFGLYLMASCTRTGSLPPGLQGLWAMDGRVPPWRGDYHCDMNVQEQFWSACPTGHLELLDVWLDFLHEIQPAAEAFTQRFFGTEGCFWTCSFLPGYALFFGGGWSTVAFAWSHTGWLAHMAWLRWRYSMDRQWLGERGYPIVSAAFDFYAANLRLEDDGHYHIPVSSSPEYNGPAPEAWTKDPNIDIALIRKCCDWIVDMEEALGRTERTSRAREIHDKLVPYHLLEMEHPAPYIRRTTKEPRVLGLWKDKMLDYSHRHPSHLMAIHPAMDITIEGSDVDREIIATSFYQYMSLGQFAWAGHTYAQMTSFAAVIGRGETARNFLRRYRDNWILPNALHFNREFEDKLDTGFSLPSQKFSEQAPFTINEPCSIPCQISDMLVQGWGGKLRIFPAVSAAWQNLLFQDLLTEGAFRVSALMRAGQTKWVRITATVDGTCALLNPFGEQAFSTAGAEPERDGDLLVWQMSAGQTVVPAVVGWETPDLQQQAAAIRAREPQRLSLA